MKIQVVRIDDTDFVLSTLWSWINPNDEYYNLTIGFFREISFILRNSIGLLF